MTGTAYLPSRRRWIAALALSALLAATLAVAGPGGASAQEAEGPRVVSSRFTSVPTHRSSDWTVDGSAWVRPPGPDAGGTYDTYESGDVIEVTHTFNEPVVVSGTLHTNMWLGGEWRGPSYVSGSGTDSLKFQYTVTDDDLDLDGVHLQAGTEEFPGISGSVTSQATGAAASFIYPRLAGPNHKVGPVPYVTDIEVVAVDEQYLWIGKREDQGDTLDMVKTIPTYGAIQLRVSYNTPVVVESDAVIEVHIGPNEGEGHGDGYRNARYIRGSADLKVQRFEYWLMEGGLSDTDGISVINGPRWGDVTAVSGGREGRSYDFRDYWDMAEFLVDAPVPPRATGFRVVSEPAHRTAPTEDEGRSSTDVTYDVGDEIQIEVTFSEPIVTQLGILPGQAVVPVNIGGRNRPAENNLWDILREVEQGGEPDVPSTTEIFTYTVQEGDLDSDGISIDAVSLQDVEAWFDSRNGFHPTRAMGFNTHIVSAATGTAASAVHGGMAAQSGHKVGNVDPEVTRAGIVSTPASGDTYRTGEKIEVAVTFSTEVEAQPKDDRHFGFEVYLDIADGDVDQDDSITDFAVALYDRGNGTDTVVFSYTLEGGESDPDGISVYGFTGTVNTVNGDVSKGWEYRFADSAATSHLSSSQSGHKVDAPTPPRIASIEVVSEPGHRTPGSGSDNAYNAGDIIDFKVTFDQPVRILDEALGLRLDDPDRPGLDVDIGGTTGRAVIYQLAELVSTPPTPEIGAGQAVQDDRQAQQADREVYFFYTVQAGDLDEDGVSVDASTAEGAGFDSSILSRDTGLAASAAHAGMPDQSGHRVGGLQPELVSVEVTGTPVAGGTYHLDETIQVTLNYNTPVTVAESPEETPYLRLAVGTTDVGTREGAYRDAEYVGGSGTTALVFEYTVAAGDDDTDGIEILDGPLGAGGDIYATSGGREAAMGEGTLSNLSDFDGSTSYNVSDTRRPIGGL